MSSTNPIAASLLEDILNLKQSYLSNEPGARESLIDLSQALITSLEIPSEAIQRVGAAEPARAAYLRICVDLQLFEHLKASGKNGISAKDLAEKAGADEVLISRIMRHLAASHTVKELDANIYSGTPLSDAMTEPKYRDGLIYKYDVARPSFNALPEYLKTIDYRNPTELSDGPFQFAHKTQLPFFGWLDTNPLYLSAFNDYMSAYRFGKPTWCDPGFYPVAERLTQGFDASLSDTFLVDVGGGLGHELEELNEKHPSLPGKLVLQDRQEVISTIPAGKQTSFEANAHDFFTPQPIVHAKTYYLHSVLHNWNDDDCVRILQNLVPAMKAGYSRILVNEIVVSDTHASLLSTSMDGIVLVLGAMRERTEAEWRNIFQRAGLHVTGIWSYPGASEFLLETELSVQEK